MCYWNRGIVMALAGLLCTPAMAVNLLTNGGFEDGPAGTTVPGWTKWGSGNDQQVRAGTAWIYNPTPRVKEGSKVYTEGTSSGGSQAGIYQQVAVTPGTEYFLTGFRHYADSNESTITHEVGVFDGAVPGTAIQAGPGDLDVDAMGNIGGETGWTFIDLSFTPTQSTVTVYTKIKSTGGSTRANWIDGLVLDSVASNQHLLTGMTPKVIADNLGDTNATITGTNLQGIDGSVGNTVKLVQGGTELTAGSVSAAVDGNSLTCTFPTTSAPFGKYNLVVEKGGVVPQTLTNEFTIRNPGLPLVTNGDFETGDLTGWTTYGDITSVVGNTAPIYVPSPGPVYEGSWSMRQQEGSTSDREGGLRQVIDVIPGEVFELTWAWGGGDDGDGSTQFADHSIGVVRGAATSHYPAQLGAEIIENTNGATFGWDPGSLVIIVPQDTWKITLDLRTWHNNANKVATYWDAVALAPTTPCVDQHSVTNVSPDLIEVTETTQLTIDGAKLDEVATVRLQNGGLILYGTIDSQSSSQIQATFNPTVLPPEGLTSFDLVTTSIQAGCSNQLAPDAVTVDCLFPISFAGVDPVVPASVTKPAGVVELTINGTNLDRLTSISLFKRAPDPFSEFTYAPSMPVTSRTIPGTVIDDSNPSAIVVEFDFYNKTVGKYDLVGTGVSACGDPETLEEVFDLFLPVDQLTIENPGFESGTLAPGWTGVDNVRGFQFFWSPHTGDYAQITANSGSSSTSTIEQMLDLPPGDYNLTLAFWTIIYDAGNCPGCSGLPSTLTATIIADEGLGTESSTTVTVVEHSANFPDENPVPEDPANSDGWLFGSIDWSGAVSPTGDIKIRFELVATGDGAGANKNWAEISLDDIAVYGVESCPVPFADADGDGDIDQADFALLQLCIGDNPLGDECRCFDTNDSGTITASDVADFADCATGPDVLFATDPNPNCIQQP